MPDITTPNTFVDGSAASATEFSQNTYRAKATPDSLEVLNGRITAPNFKSGETVNFESVREKAFSCGTIAGSTLNIDLPLEVMIRGYDLAGYIDDNDRTDGGTAGGTLTRAQMQALTEEHSRPIVAVAYYLPYDCTQVTLSWGLSLVVSDAWQIIYNNDFATNGFTGDGANSYSRHQFTDKAFLSEIYADTGWVSGWPPADGFINTITGEEPTLEKSLGTDDNLLGTRCNLFIDDDRIEGVTRNFRDGTIWVADYGPHRSAASKAEKIADPYDYIGTGNTHDIRFWNGTLTIDSNIGSSYLTKGWHTASIRVIHDRRVVRVKCRRMQAHGIR